MLRSLLILSFLLTAFVAESQTIYSRANGDWDQVGTWSTVAVDGASCGCVPGAGDDVVIDGRDIDIDAGTGDVTVNSLLVTNAVTNDGADLTIEGGSTLTVTNDFTLVTDGSGDDADLTIRDNGSGLDVGGNFLLFQDNGSDDVTILSQDNADINITGTMTFDIDGGDETFFTMQDDSRWDVTGDVTMDMDGGDDIEWRIDDAARFGCVNDFDIFHDGGDDIDIWINVTSGTTAQINIGGDMLWDHDAGDDMRLEIDDVNSVMTVGGDLTINQNDGNGDDTNIRMDNGSLTVTGALTGTRLLSTDELVFDLDGNANLTCGDLTVNASGPLFTNGAIWFFLDGSSQINCSSFSANFTGADDLYIHLNRNGGTDAQLNVTNDMTLTRTAGDDIHFYLDDDDSEVNIGGNFTYHSSGLDSEEWELDLNNNSTFDVAGNCTLTSVDGEDVAGNDNFINLQGGGDMPTFHVGGNFSWTSTINLVDTEIIINGGTFDIDGDFSITQNAGGNDFDVYANGGATCTVGGNMTMTNNGGDDMSFYLGTTGTATNWTVTGNTSMIQNNATAGATWRQQIYNGSIWSTGGAMTQTTNFATSDLHLVDVQDNSEVVVSGNVNLNAPAAGELEIQLIDNSFFRIGGSFIRAAAPNNFGTLDCTVGTPTVEYNGTGAQVIAEDAGGGADFFYYHNLEVDNTFGTIPMLTMEGLATVFGDLTMNDGIVASDATNILVVADNGTTSNASDASYVDGYTRKVGDDAYTFPVGDGGFYGPLSMTAPGTTTDQFEAQHIYNTAHDDGFDSSSHDATFKYISKVEYWRFNRTAGASTPRITLSWDDPRSGGVGDINDLRFARWDGSVWRDMGAMNLTGTTASGTLDNNTGITAFADNRPYTLATTDAINPLPIELLSFDAVMRQGYVDLDWVTKSELNNDYFTIEKSRDTENWEFVLEEDGAGNSSSTLHYSAIDPSPYKGVSYYRLRQTDFDGAFEYSDIVAVSNDLDLTLYPNPTDGDVFISGESLPEEIEIYNALGQRVEVSFVKSNGLLQFSTEDMVPGTYVIRFTNEALAQTMRFVVTK